MYTIPPARLRLLAIVIAALSIAFFAVRVSSYVMRPTGGFLSYYTSGVMLLHGDDMRKLYDNGNFTDVTRESTGLISEDYFRANPPTLAFCMAPFATLPISYAKLLWELFSLGCVILGLHLLIRVLDVTTTERIVLTALAFASFPLYVNFVWGQLYAVLFLIHVLLMRAWIKEHHFHSGITITLLLLLKGYGLMFLLLALFEKRWKVVAYAVMLYIAAVAASSMLIGIGPWGSYATALAALMTSAAPAATFQQNVWSFVNWFLLPDRWNPHPLFSLPQVAGPVGIALTAVAIAMLFWFARKTPNNPIPLVVAMIIGVLTAPMLYDYHYVLVLPAIFVAYRHLSTESTFSQSLLFAATLLLLTPKIPYHTSIFQSTWLGILGFPRVYGSVLLLWLLGRIAASRGRLSLTSSQTDQRTFDIRRI